MTSPEPTVAYVALCVACGYTGPERASNLVALRDFDRHAERASHAIAVLAAERGVVLEDEDQPAPESAGQYGYREVRP